MIVRVVKMTLREEETNTFSTLFNAVKPDIAAFEGCFGVELMYDVSQKNIYFTISRWQSEESLELYRESALFRNTWAKVKPLFSDKAQAWSLCGDIAS